MFAVDVDSSVLDNVLGTSVVVELYSDDELVAMVVVREVVFVSFDGNDVDSMLDAVVPEQLLRMTLPSGSVISHRGSLKPVNVIRSTASGVVGG